MDRRTIEVGQRFERLGRWRRTWEVEAVLEGAGRVANVVLRDVADPVNKCTLAPQALLDTSRFRSAGRGQPQPAGDGVMRKPRPRQSLPVGRHGVNQVIVQPRQRQETAMMIENRSPDGYVIICKHKDEDHRFVAKHPGGQVACPQCGYAAKSVSLLLDYIGAAPPWRQINAPLRRRAGSPSAPANVHQLEPVRQDAAPRSALAKILTLPRRRQKA